MCVYYLPIRIEETFDTVDVEFTMYQVPTTMIFLQFKSVEFTNYNLYYIIILLLYLRPSPLEEEGYNLYQVTLCQYCQWQWTNL